MGAPYYVVFAGVNGAGKTTFFRTGLWRTREMPKSMARVNPDEILRDFGGDSRSAADNLEAGRRALGRIEGNFRRRRSFNQETTLCGRSALKNIVRAHELGYRVHLYYIGVESPDVAISRVDHRVNLGGHGIDATTVRRRFNVSLSNLARSLDLTDQVAVFDNTTEFSCLALWSRGTLAWWGGRAGRSWLADAIVDDSIWKRSTRV